MDRRDAMDRVLTGRSDRPIPSENGRFDESSGGTPLVLMMEATNFGDLDHPSAIGFLDFAMLRAVHLEREMRARMLIVVEVIAQHSPQMPLIQDPAVHAAVGFEVTLKCRTRRRF